MKIKPGSEVGFIKVLKDTGERTGTYKIWECECTRCGNICYKSTEQLRTAKSCGCYRRDRMSAKGEERNEIFNANPDLAGKQQSLRGKANTNNHSSGIRGVTWDKTKHKWSVQIMHKKKVYNLGRFVHLEDAAAVRKSAEDAVRKDNFEMWIKEYKNNK